MQININTIRSIALIFFCCIFLLSCFKKSDDDLRKKENEKLDEYLNKSTLTFYKAIKIALRSSSDPTRDPEIAKAAATILRLGQKGLSIIPAAGDSGKTVNIIDLLVMAKDFYAARDILVKKDEDIFPTILENIGAMSHMNSKYVMPAFGNFVYDKNLEHVILGILWTASLKAPAEFPLYELNKVDDNKIPYTDLKLLTQLSKALSYSQNKFHFHALDKSGECTAFLEQNKTSFISNPPVQLSNMDGKQMYYHLHMLAISLHAISFLELKKEDEAMKDFEIALEDAKNGGLDNELTWMIGAYVHIKKEEYDKALVDLSKLEKSNFFSEPERTAIAEAKTYLEKREDGKAFNSLRDKIAISNIMYRLMENRLKEAKQLKDLQNNEEGKRLFQLHDEINKNSQYIEKISEGIHADSLAGKATDLVKGLLGK